MRPTFSHEVIKSSWLATFNVMPTDLDVYKPERWLDDALFRPVLRALGRVGEENVAEVKGVMADYFRSRDQLEAVTRKELLSRMDSGSVLLLDVRSEAEFAIGHVPGALNIPADTLERRLCELPNDQEIVAYCRGPYCVLSFEVVAALRANGYKARRLQDGFPEWRAAGLQIEIAA